MPFAPGDAYEETFSISQEEVNAFAQLSGDTNPIHTDPDFAAGTVFKRTVVHGMFVAAVFSRVMGAKFPGYGSVYLSQTLDFKRPVYPGEECKVRVQIEEIDAKGRARLSTTISYATNGKLAVSGEAWALLPKSE